MRGVGQVLGKQRRRIAAGLALSVALHGAVVWWLWRKPAARLAREEPPVELEVVERVPEVTPPAAPAGESPERATRPTRRRETRARASAPATPSPLADEGAPTVDSHPLMRMREGPIDLSPGNDTLARALGPVEAPPADEKPRRKPRLPGTGLTTLVPEIDEKALQRVHPRAFEVLTKVEKLFRPDRIRMTDEVKGELGANPTLKHWLFGSLGNDPEALRNLAPSLACLVCVTLRPGVSPEVELSGPSGSPWFDRAARESLERAAVPERPDDALDPAKACYRFSAKVWRTRPDVTDLLAIPFRLNFQSTVRLISYQKI